MVSRSVYHLAHARWATRHPILPSQLYGVGKDRGQWREDNSNDFGGTYTSMYRRTEVFMIFWLSDSNKYLEWLPVCRA